ncbi:hypothetical protein HYH03_014788 [Edaphochlamys debaryana]|uniref:tRNA threonylcarbamoyladenosine biosynthesis protein TsaE n=1 Tax=Edaphochlamys debaryana TaxID=47281 RepID=A0A835XVA0_9CHLO|nr:hypothetical protein HYH03_014788 [Edaphochlamys debaryana]|eukprot:KAG2486484.1 hypothetical protein HYH03_014788 [Edaphochlamys debaryana]
MRALAHGHAVVWPQLGAARRLRRALVNASQIATPLLARAPASTAARSHATAVGSAPPVERTEEHRLGVPSAQALDVLAALFASHIRPGDCYCLFGAVGAGKSVFSRAFIRAVAEDDFLPVPSPTFLLQNTYDEHDGPPIHHFDFYRLTSVQDFNRLDLQGSLVHAVSLMEWPERLPTLPGEYLAIHIQVVDQLPERPTSICDDDPDGNGGGNGGGDCGPSSKPISLAGLARGRWRHRPSRGRAYAVEGSYDSDGESISPTSTWNALDDEELEMEDFTDRRPRLVTLTPHGSYWEGRARRIISYVAAHSDACEGLYVLDSPATEAATAGAGAAAAASNGNGSAATLSGGSGGNS